MVRDHDLSWGQREWQGYNVRRSRLAPGTSMRSSWDTELLSARGQSSPNDLRQSGCFTNVAGPALPLPVL